MARTAFRLALAVKKIIIKYAKMLIGKRRIDCILYDLNNMNQFTSLAGHEGMLADSVRVEGYYKGIQRNVKPGDIVVDLGTGTGILSFFASQRNPEKIYAIDHSPFISVAQAVARGEAERGVVICGSGVGVAIAANKVAGIHASVCHDVYSAHQGVEHDAMNVLVLGARVIGPSLAEELLMAFLKATFSEEPRHVRRLEKVRKVEASWTEGGSREVTL